MYQIKNPSSILRQCYETKCFPYWINRYQKILVSPKAILKAVFKNNTNLLHEEIDSNEKIKINQKEKKSISLLIMCEFMIFAFSLECKIEILIPFNFAFFVNEYLRCIDKRCSDDEKLRKNKKFMENLFFNISELNERYYINNYESLSTKFLQSLQFTTNKNLRNLRRDGYISSQKCYYCANNKKPLSKKVKSRSFIKFNFVKLPKKCSYKLEIIRRLLIHRSINFDFAKPNCHDLLYLIMVFANEFSDTSLVTFKHKIEKMWNGKINEMDFLSLTKSQRKFLSNLKVELDQIYKTDSIKDIISKSSCCMKKKLLPQCKSDVIKKKKKKEKVIPHPSPIIQKVEEINRFEGIFNFNGMGKELSIGDDDDEEEQPIRIVKFNEMENKIIPEKKKLKGLFEIIEEGGIKDNIIYDTSLFVNECEEEEEEEATRQGPPSFFSNSLNSKKQKIDIYDTNEFIELFKNKEEQQQQRVVGNKNKRCEIVDQYPTKKRSKK